MTGDMLAQRDSAGTPAAPVNLITDSETFEGPGWWQANGALTRRAADMAPPAPGIAVIEHMLSEATQPDTAAIFGCVVTQGLTPAPMHVASVYVLLPEDFAGSVVGVLISGVASWQLVNANVTQFGIWQRVWASARLPPDAAGVNPTLFVVGPAGARVFTSGWKVEAGTQPTDYAPGVVAPPPAAPAPAPAATAVAAPRPPAGSFYRRVTLDELAREIQSGPSARTPVERFPLLDPPVLIPTTLALRAPLNGTAQFDRAGIAFHPSGDFSATKLRPGPLQAYMLRGATVHGPHGTVTIGDRVIAETAPDGAAGEETLWLPNRPVSVKLQTGYHLLSCIRDNYYHWLIDVLSRFRLADFEKFARQPEATSPPVLLHPPLDAPWKRQTLALLVPKSLPRLVLEEEGRIEVAHLLYVPDLTGGVMNPHPALMEAFDTMRASALGGLPPQAPFRKIFVSRAGSPNRVLANEAEVAARAEAAGFTQIQPASLSVPEQIRMFAEASHIIAPHGAGLANIVFCQPGAALCELHMDAYVHQAYRSLAALRGLRYFCLVGTVETPARPDLFRNSWHLDPKTLDTVLADPAFTSAPPPPAAAPAETPPAPRWWQRFLRRSP